MNPSIQFLRALFMLGASLFLLIAAGALPAAQAQSVSAFHAEYFDNAALRGQPALTRDDAAINFSWPNGVPDGALSSGNFSVRWTRWYDVSTAGPFTFTLTTDDGGRLWVDGELVVDVWYDHAPLPRAATLNLGAGYHLIRVEYYNHGGSATALLDISSEGDSPGWKGEYFNNPDLSGEPALTTQDSAIDFNWAAGSPDPAIPADHFSVRWTRSQYFTAGAYHLSVTSDDGVRVWLGGNVIIDEWHDMAPKTFNADFTLPAGVYPIRIEHYEGQGAASIKFSIAPKAAPGVTWNGQYYNNSTLTGNPALVRQDADLAFTWGTAGPGSKISGSAFSARWDSTRNTGATGFYTIYATADDGLRVSVDGKGLIDEWRDQPPTTFAATVYLAAGPHQWHVEYYQHLGAATLKLQIVPGVTPPLTGAVGDVIVEDGSAGWVTGGDPTNWNTTPNGSGGKALWLSNNAFLLPNANWGRWYPALTAARNYEVFAYIPGGVATTRNARYWIAHAGSYSVASIAQGLYKNQWVSLGTYYFTGAGSEYVMLADTTYECAGCFAVAWDALKFSPR